jgi:hypothetical protein
MGRVYARLFSSFHTDSYARGYFSKCASGVHFNVCNREYISTCASGVHFHVYIRCTFPRVHQGLHRSPARKQGDIAKASRRALR